MYKPTHRAVKKPFRDISRPFYIKKSSSSSRFKSSIPSVRVVAEDNKQDMDASKEMKSILLPSKQPAFAFERIPMALKFKPSDPNIQVMDEDQAGSEEKNRDPKYAGEIIKVIVNDLSEDAFRGFLDWVKERGSYVGITFSLSRPSTHVFEMSRCVFSPAIKVLKELDQRYPFRPQGIMSYDGSTRFSFRIARSLLRALDQKKLGMILAIIEKELIEAHPAEEDILQEILVLLQDECRKSSTIWQLVCKEAKPVLKRLEIVSEHIRRFNQNVFVD